MRFLSRVKSNEKHIDKAEMFSCFNRLQTSRPSEKNYQYNYSLLKQTQTGALGFTDYITLGI